MENAFATILENGILGAVIIVLFYMLFYVIKRDGDREKRLYEIVGALSEQIPLLGESLRAIGHKIDTIENKIGNIENKLD